MVCEIEQNACQKWDLPGKVFGMQKKQSEKRTLRTFFMFCAAVMLTGSVLPVMAVGTDAPSGEEVHIYSLSSSDSDPLGTLKKQMIETADSSEAIDEDTSVLTAVGFDSTKTGIQNVTLHLTSGKETLSTSYTEVAAVKVTEDTAPVIQLTSDTVDLNNGDEWNASSYIKYLYDETGKLPALKESGTVDTSTDGTYEAVYTVIDLEGQTSKASLTVNVTTPGPTPEELAAQAEAEAAEEAAQQAAAEKAAQAAQQTAVSTSSLSYSNSGSNPYSGGWSNCTYGAWQAVYENLGIALPSFGSATNWLASAQAAGYSTGSAPRAGSVAVYYGHVAYVSAVSADGSSVYLIEGGYCGHYNERWAANGGTSSQPLIGYIYF
jgi:surface antigen